MSDTAGRKLSVVVPIYAVEDYLANCIDSIIAQTYHCLEIILVDDGAKGREPEICDEYAKKDGRIKVIHIPNSGPVVARKTGIANATGEYVTFIDGDDYIATNLYELMMQCQAQTDADLVAVSFVSENGQSHIQGIKSGIYVGGSLQWLFRNMNCKDEQYFTIGIWHSNWSKIYKTELLSRTAREVPDSIRIGSDIAMTFPYILACRTIAVDNSITGYYYRILPQSLSRTCDQLLFSRLNALYTYLRPFYVHTNDAATIRQLEYLRTRLIEVGLKLWMTGGNSGPLCERTRQLRLATESLDLFNNVEVLLGLAIPAQLLVAISAIADHDWTRFILAWKTYVGGKKTNRWVKFMKKAASFCLPAVVKKTLKTMLKM